MMKVLPKLAIVAVFLAPLVLISLFVKGFVLQAILAVAAFYGVDYALAHTRLGAPLGYRQIDKPAE